MARHAGSRRDRAEAGTAADNRTPERIVDTARKGSRQSGRAFRVQRPARGGIPGRTRANSGGDVALHGGGHRPGERSVWFVRRHVVAAAGCNEVSAATIDMSIVWPALLAGLL